ncbi:MAG: hypothetical protein J6C23_06630 [Clostridia bacterium]|nr:hypothetical protein [Clostridia bacterium]
MELYALNLYFLGDTQKEREYDYCAHGKIVFKIDGHNLSNEVSYWCASVSAYRFLRSIFENHFIGAEEQMIPCCGHFLIPSHGGSGVIISGCPNGIDFDVIHKDNDVIIRTQSGVEYTVTFEDYKATVLSYVKQIQDFYLQNPPRQFENKFDQDGFSAFCCDWHSLLAKANALDENNLQISKITFDGCDSFAENDIAKIYSNGILLKNMKFISFRECAYNFQQIHGGNGICVAERDITDSALSFVFYTAPKTTRIVFLQKSKIKEFFSKRKTAQRFYDLQKQIESFGYTTYDKS